MRRVLLRPIGIALALAAVAAGAAGAAPTASYPGGAAGANAWAVRISIPHGREAAAIVVRSPPAASSASRPSLSYPRDGSVIVSGALRAKTRSKGGVRARSAAASTVADLSVFGGEITADSAAAHVTAAIGSTALGGRFEGTKVVNLQALGQRRRDGRIQLADWGYLTIAEQGVDTTAPEGAKGYRGYTAAVDIHLTAAHRGLPAGSEIQLGYAEADVQTVPAGVPGTLAAVSGAALPGDRPQLLPPSAGPLIGVPQIVQPELEAGPYVFPVFGPSSYADTYGSLQSGSSLHHGVDILGDLGQPLLALADGTIFSAGWNRVAGNRLWLRDGAGDEFLYSHLSAFSLIVKKGAHVRAGQVIGFMGNTGDAERKPTHLHLEVHPVSLLFLGADGAVDPAPYLRGWQRLENLSVQIATGWAPKVPGTIQAPPPGAVLIGSTDISSADGLDPSTLRRLAPAPGHA